MIAHFRETKAIKFKEQVTTLSLVFLGGLMSSVAIAQERPSNPDARQEQATPSNRVQQDALVDIGFLGIDLTQAFPEWHGMFINVVSILESADGNIIALAPDEAKNDTGLVHLAIGTHHYAFPRNYIAFYKSHVKNQNLVMLQLYMPDFTPIRRDQCPYFKEQAFQEHVLEITITLKKDKTGVEYLIADRAKRDDPVALKPGPFGLFEVFDKTSPNVHLSQRQFIGEVDDSKVWIKCQDFDFEGTKRQPQFSCGFENTYHDLAIGLSIGSPFTADWQKIYRDVVRMLDNAKED